ncbi:MAG: bifunctional methylenetetrahydrofolate dehydrogenase/methenyltetrahydrofolate cyclohydrolase FolD [Solirubrobacterales bacterium]|nr:bifunctional methylenetetrahydrofolate dehydrogenase/methenyltetrahydrofolate cyclohydrolase FolD [Solirubrobacterales bacterium]
MSARVIDGKLVAAAVRGEVADAVKALVASGKRPPGLATIIVGDDPASAVYVANKHKACEEVGFVGFHNELESSATEDQIGDVINRLNADPAVDGILLQLPLPSHLEAGSLTETISPAKDVDGLTPTSAGLLSLGRKGLRPCTPLGVVELLDREGVDLNGSNVVILGRSALVGKPLAALLLERNATVTICHSRTKNLQAVCCQADVLVAAVGVPELVKGDWVKQGATVIDVGINRVDGGLVGDVDYEAAAEFACCITPVPGGVGPMTIAMLLRNTLAAYGESS